LFFSILLLAHFQAAIIPILLGIRSIKKFKHIRKNELIPLGFIFLGLASISEMIDHTQTSWIYVDHSSLFNWLFYSFLSLGLACLSISVIKNKFIQKTNFYAVPQKVTSGNFNLASSNFLVLPSSCQ